MTRRALVTVAALASVLTLGLAPTAAHAGKPADKAPSSCEDLGTKGNKTFDCENSG